MRSKILTMGIILPVILVLDLWTKSWALRELADGPMEGFFGGWIPLHLAFNTGAAFGLTIGDDPRLIFIPITLVALVLLTVLYVQADRKDYLRLVSVSLVYAGALGNLYDRVRWERGVVDFIGPIDLGFMNWPIFNVADSAITCGAILLAISFWNEGKEEQAAAMDDDSSTAEPAV